MASLSSSSDVIRSSSMDDQPCSSTKDEEEEERELDGQTQFELLHAIERFLEGGKFGRAAAALRRDINERKLVPSRTDFEGLNHVQNYRQFLSALSNLPSTSQINEDSLPQMISRLSTLSDRAVSPRVKGLKLRLITNKRNALQRKHDVLLPPRRPILMHGRKGNVVVINKTKDTKMRYSPIEFLRGRELGSRVSASLLPGEKSIELIERHFRIHSHLASVYCVKFDRTENYVITGSDDNLVKVFSLQLAMLRFTYRGHSAEITDLAVSHCNQLVASASNDKTLRVWSLRNGETLHVFKHHTASLVSVLFPPFTGSGSIRYLVSTGNDCIANFYMFNQDTLEFPGREGLVYHGYERDQPGAKMISISHSPGGHMVIIGETHGVVRVYRLHDDRVEKLNDIIAHTEKVDSMVWAHNGLKFCSGSKDGTAKIWQFQYGEWTQTVLSLSQEELFLICGVNATLNNPNSKNRYKVGMVCWTLDDSRIVTTGSDFSVRVWDTNGSQLMKLSSLHTNDAYLLCAHPIYPHIVISSGHDGIVAMWDVMRGVLLHKWTNLVEHGEMSSIYDIALTGDGTRFAIVDGKGQVALYGLGTFKRKFPRVQFFHTDYHPLLLDNAGYVLDESTGIAPHLMPPLRLVNVQMVEHPTEVQAMVPGRGEGGADVNDGELECPWLRRSIAPKLGENELKTWEERQLILNETERNEYVKESTRERPSFTPTPEAIVPFAKKTRSFRPTSFRAAMAAEALALSRQNRQARMTQANRMAIMRRDVDMRYIGIQPQRNERGTASMNEEGEDEERVEDIDEEEDETDTSDTDYESEGERRQRQREREREREGSWQGTMSRPRRREREREVEMEVEEEEIDESSQHSRSARRRRRRAEDDEFGNDLSIDMNEPSTSSGRRRGRREGTQERTERIERPGRGSGRSRRVRVSTDREEEEEEVEMVVEEPEMEETLVREERSTVRRQPNARERWKLTFPDWVREVKRKRFPYIAQLGDHVVYFRQGHEHYLNEVDKAKLYPIDTKMIPKSDMKWEEHAIVDDVKYLLKPYRLTQLKLARTDADGRRTGQTFIVKYHDMDNVPDFIILSAYYDEGLALGLDVGDEIEAAIDDQWWSGTVESINRNEAYPNALWLCVGVRYNSGEDGELSLWDLRRKEATRRGATQPMSEEEISNLGSVPCIDGDWPEGDENGEMTRRRIKRALNDLVNVGENSVFNLPVCLQAYSDYPSKVAYPIDIQTICERIDSQFYRRLRSLQQDVRCIALAAEAYNLQESSIVRNAKVLVEAIIRLTNDPTIEEFAVFFDSCRDLDDSELVEYKRRPRAEVNSEMLEMLREQENGIGGGDTPAGWIRDALEIIEDLIQQPCARHFVTKDEDSEELTWESCDDLRILCEKVRGGQMATPKEVESEMHSLVSMVKSCQDRRQEIYKDAMALHHNFSTRFKSVLSKFESVQASVQATLGVSLERSMRRRVRDAPQHSYNTRRSDQTALTAAALAAAAAQYDELPTTSRSAARHERGFYRSMINGRGYAESEEIEVSSTSSRRARKSTRNTAVKVEEEAEEEEIPVSRSSRNTRATRRVQIEEEEEDEDEGDTTLEAPIEQEVKDEEEEDAADSDYDEEYSRGKSKKNGRGRKRIAESTEEDESANASTSTASSTRRSERKRKRRKISSGEEEEEDEEDTWGRGRKKESRRSTRPTRASARNSQQTYNERSDDEEEERAIAPVRRMARRARTTYAE